MNKKNKGFTLIELLIVVAIIGIIAAIAIPSLLRARISANEAGTTGDIKAVQGAQVAFAGQAVGYYGPMLCLSDPTQCIPAYPANSPTFLDPQLTNNGTLPLPAKSGYERAMLLGAPPATPPAGIVNVVSGFCYSASPVTVNQTGVRNFAGDASGRICFELAAAPIDVCVSQAGAQLANLNNTCAGIS